MTEKTTNLLRFFDMVILGFGAAHFAECHLRGMRIFLDDQIIKSKI